MAWSDRVVNDGEREMKITMPINQGFVARICFFIGLTSFL